MRISSDGHRMNGYGEGFYFSLNSTFIRIFTTSVGYTHLTPLLILALSTWTLNYCHLWELLSSFERSSVVALREDSKVVEVRGIIRCQVKL